MNAQQRDFHSRPSRGRRIIGRRPWLLAGGAALLTCLASCGGGNYYGYGYGGYGYGGYGYGGYGYGPGPAAVQVPNSIAVADVNGDGAPDLLVATTLDEGLALNPGVAAVYLGNTASPGTYQAGANYSTLGANPSGIAVVDLTGSGSEDLVVSTYGSGSASIFMHDPANPGKYLAGTNLVTGGQPNQVVSADINGDGKPDLAFADLSASGNAVVLLQDPANPGQFLAPLNLPTGYLTPSVAIGDLNGDGKPDIVAANFDTNGNNGRVTLFFQDPANPGTFLAPVSYATPYGAIDVAVADLDGDGRPDLVVASLGPGMTGSVSVLLQSAATAGTFRAATSYAGFGQPLSVAVADLNGDGHPDIAVADAYTATVMLQNAATPGTFADAVPVN